MLTSHFDECHISRIPFPEDGVSQEIVSLFNDMGVPLIAYHEVGEKIVVRSDILFQRGEGLHIRFADFNDKHSRYRDEPLRVETQDVAEGLAQLKQLFVEASQAGAHLCVVTPHPYLGRRHANIERFVATDNGCARKINP